MAFAYTVAKKGVAGNLRYAIVNYTNGGGDTGGEISNKFLAMKFVYLAIPTTETTQAGTMIRTQKNTSTNGSVTITTVAGEDGTVFVLGI
jgi:hypothetical protein